jgi:hypothetical protein
MPISSVVNGWPSMVIPAIAFPLNLLAITNTINSKEKFLRI